MNIKRISILTVLSLITFSSCKEEVKEKKAISKLVKYTSVDVSSANKIRTFSGTVLAGDAIGLSFRNSGEQEGEVTHGRVDCTILREAMQETASGWGTGGGLRRV